ncbi:hypothetical protein BGC07_06130 [Piscirickettsia litoralis]|uniref:Secreted protein n=1 Tax=Piscirickettsia litoralis TaxID=1891921 RepID=A0ABX3A144_9GAMM|nr:hypothetical protein BGC07_06130 [Piscirickettsia litoralis]
MYQLYGFVRSAASLIMIISTFITRAAIFNFVSIHDFLFGVEYCKLCLCGSKRQTPKIVDGNFLSCLFSSYRLPRCAIIVFWNIIDVNKLLIVMGFVF